MDQKPLPPDLYDHDYYVKSLPGMEQAENPDLIDEAGTHIIAKGYVRAGQYVLDFGCGRGTCLVKLALNGASGIGIDHSPHAIEFAQQYTKRYSEITDRIVFLCSDAARFHYEHMFDVIIFNQIYEHLHDWELTALFDKFKKALKPGGSLVISTPNLDYIRRLFPIKRVLNLPGKIIKESLRVLRGKSRHAESFAKFMKEIFKIRYPKSEHDRLHINLQTPRSIKNFVEQQGFRVRLECVDAHRDPATLLTRSFWGETLWLYCVKS